MDLFSKYISRNDVIEPDELVRLFVAARAENKVQTYRCLFWAREMNECDSFHIILNYIRVYYTREWRMTYRQIPQRGHWKDFFLMTPNDELIKFVVEHLDGEHTCARAMPRKGMWFQAVRRYMNVPPKDLRHLLVTGSRAKN